MSLPAKEDMRAQVGRFASNSMLLTSATEILPEHDVPNSWTEMLRSQEVRRTTWAEPWEPYRALLPGVLDFLEHKVRGVCVLLEAGQPPSLLYVYGRVEDLYFYRGGPPLGDAAPKDPRRIWTRLPPKLRAFYQEAHNGWTQLSSSSLGPLPFEDIEFLADYKWGGAGPDELNPLLPFRLEDTVMVLSNGGGDSLCLDLHLDSPEDQALCWWHEDPLGPNLAQNLWDLMDGWICGQLEDVDVVN